MVALGFLNPLLLWALPMAAVPIIMAPRKITPSSFSLYTLAKMRNSRGPKFAVAIRRAAAERCAESCRAGRPSRQPIGKGRARVALAPAHRPAAQRGAT